jgi:hypothetical protein
MRNTKIVPVNSLAPVMFPGDSCVELHIEGNMNFSKLIITLESNYYDGIAPRIVNQQQISLGEYLRTDDHQADNHLMCVEMPLPRSIVSKMHLHISERSISAGNAVCLFHAGRAGCIAPLHYDWDHKWVLHACLTGRKTLYFFSPDVGWLLNPIVNTSAICVPRLSKIDRAAVLCRLGGTEVNLTAGQAVLFPSVWWHAARYEVPSTSVSVRFGEQIALRPFAVLPRSFWLQRLVWEFFQQKTGLDPNKYLTRCLAVFFSRCSWTDRYYKTNATYRCILEEMGQPYGTEYLVSDNFNSEMHIAKDELKHLYSLNDLRKNPKISVDSLEDIRSYLFERSGEVPYKTQQAMAKYAFAKRQGLKPRRGLIVVHRREGTKHRRVAVGRMLNHDDGT